MNDTAYLFSGLEMSLGLALNPAFHQEMALSFPSHREMALSFPFHRESPLAPVNPLAPARQIALHQGSAVESESEGMSEKSLGYVAPPEI